MSRARSALVTGSRVAMFVWAALQACTFDESKLDAIACDSDSECLPYESCLRGACSRRPCTDTSECGAGARCEDGRCGAHQASSFAEMCASPGVVFCDDFEDGFDSDWIEDGGDVRLVADSAIEGEGSQVLELATYEGQLVSKLLLVFAQLEQAWVRFDVRYPDDFVDYEGAVGPALGGSDDPPYGMLGISGFRPTGDDFFLLRVKPAGPDTAALLGLEGYFVNMVETPDGQYLANSLAPEDTAVPAIQPGRWQCVEMGIRLNAPDDSDGTAEYRVDDTVSGPRGGIVWRTVEGAAVNTLSLDSYNSFLDGAPPANRPNLVRFDNVLVSREPAGCL